MKGISANSRFWIILAGIGLFTVIYVFFALAHPLIPMSDDEWGTVSYYSRIALPQITSFEPGRIFPAVLGPLLGYFAAYIIYPLNGDYIHAITISAALLMALFSLLLFVSFKRLFYAFSKDNFLSIFGALFVFVLYFLVFKNNRSVGGEYVHMLWSTSLCGAVWYAVPNMLNSTLVLYFMREIVTGKNITIHQLGIKKFGCIIMVLYFAIFSILWACAILGVYSFYKIIDTVLQNRKKPFQSYFQQIQIHIVVLTFFILYCFFEFTSGRAAGLMDETQTTGLVEEIIQSIKMFASLMKQINIIFLVFGIGCSVIGTLVFCLTKKESRYFPIIKTAGMVFFCSLSLAIFYILAASMAGASYVSRIDAVYGVYFYGILFISLAVLYVMCRFKRLFVLSPLLFVIMFNQTLRVNDGFSDGSYPFTSQFKYEFSHRVITQIQEADKRGESSITIITPVKWRFGNPAWALRSHNLTSKFMNVEFIAERNETVDKEEFQIPKLPLPY